MNGEKRYIPGTKSKWDYELPDDMTNSMVAKDGRSVDTGWNFDEYDDDKGELESTDIEKSGWDSLMEGPEE
jgi:hypothetical protein